MDLNNLLFEAANKSIRFSRFDFKSGLNELESTTILLQLILYHYEHAEYSEKEEVKVAIKKLLDDVLYNGYEPAFDNSHNWGYSLLCESFALIKHKEDLWSMFNAEDQARITLLMKMFALMWNFGCNAGNRYNTGIGLNGNYGKDSGPNYRLTNNILIPYIAKFFGDLHQVNLFFQYEADYDVIINQLKAFKFRNAYITWTRPGIEFPDGTVAPGAKELYNTREHVGSGEPAISAYSRDLHGNIVYLGQGHGCRQCYHYLPYKSTVQVDRTSYEGVINDVLDDCFNGGNVVSKVYIEDEDEWCRMLDDAISPYEGQAGMMKEFNIPDDGMGQRSSIFHCEIDFNLVCACLATFKYLEIAQLVDLPMWDQIKTGMSDFLFKYEHSYQGYSMGRFEPDSQTSQLSATTAIWSGYWTTNLLGG
jgi:hypothetical protein